MFGPPDQPSSVTILIADDQEPNRSLLEEILKAEGLQVVFAEDGAAAWEQFTRTKPDLVLLDVMMPGMTGFDVCQKIGEQIPITARAYCK